ncbi:tetratricopeptide repeat protein [Kribbella sp. NPDC050124]|uniref:tetratricopeptide repeat protein n=1 Tax=Kribbella sp. NPDC050124 TaxID=3364114 RepID=UPI00378B4830
MLVGAMSEDCYHCVAYRDMASRDELGDFMKSVKGSVCPFCRVRTQSFWLVMDSADVNAIRSGNLPASDPAGVGFERFGTPSPAAAGQSSAAAKILRAQVSGAAERQRLAMLEKIGDLYRAEFAFRGGEEALEAGDRAKAITAFTICAGTGKPEAHRAAFRLGDLATEDGRSTDALRWYRRTAESDEPEIRAVGFLYLGIALHRTSQWEDALAAFRSAVACGPTTAHGLAAHRIGQVLADLGRRSEAKAAYGVAVGLEAPGSAEAALALGALEDEDGNWDAARKFAEYAYKSNEEHVKQTAAFNLARYWEQRGRRSKARKYYEIAARGADSGLAARAAAIVRASR